MNYAILWLLSLSLLILAPIWALTRRQQSKQARPLWLALALLLSLFGILVGGLQVAGSFALHYLGYETSFLNYSVSWLLCFPFAMIILCVRGLRTHDGRHAFSLWNSRRIGWATLIILVSYFFTLLASHAYEMAALTRMQQYAALEIDALIPRPPLDKENAALEYQRAFKHMISTFSNENLEARWKHFLEGQDFSAPAFDTKSPILLKCLEKQAPALDIFRQASQMRDCYFEHPYSHPTTDMKLPELSQFRTGAKLLAASARLHAASGNLEAAFKDLSAIDRMAEHVSREPVFVATLISIALHSISVSTLEGILRSTSPSIDSLKSWVPVDIPFLDQVSKRGFTGEYAMGLHYFSQTGETESIFSMDSTAPDGPAPVQITLAKIYWRVYFMPSDLNGYREYMQILKNSAGSHFTVWNEVGERESAKARKNGMKSKGIMCSLTIPVTAHGGGVYTRAEANNRLKKLVRAVCVYRAETNRFPDSLTQLIPHFIDSIPTDPFNNLPLRMKRFTAGVSLYSVGQNLLDDDGSPPVGENTDTGDVVFRIGVIPLEQ